MQNSQSAFHEAVERAKQIAQKLSASAPNAAASGPSLKRPNSEDDHASKRSAVVSPTQSQDSSSPVIRAQLIAQQINSTLGIKTSGDSSTAPLSNQSVFQEDYKIPDKFVGLVIGKGGEQIVRLQAESGCKVQICQTRPDPVPGETNPPDRLATLCGTRDAIDRAKRIMDDIILKGRMADTNSNGANTYSVGGATIKSIDVLLPSAKCGLVIGKGGENIRRVSEEFSVKMYVVQTSSDIDGIEHKPLRIMGESDRVERAKQYVLDSLAKSGNMPNPAARPNANSSVTYNEYGSRVTGGTPITGPCNEATYNVPYEKAGIIIGKGGESIKEINRKSGAFVELDKMHPSMSGNLQRVFKLRGTPEQIVTAQQLMYDKVANGPGGPGDMLPPIQFQQQFNLPLVGSTPLNDNNDPYSNGANNNDPYSQWASVYGQWPQLNSYDQSTTNNNGNSSAANANAASGMGQMDPAWLAYYQSMSYYSMMQASMTGNTSSAASTSTTTTKPTDSTATTSSATSTSGQADYSQQWIEYYRSMGQNQLADEIERQMKQSNSTSTATTSSSNNPWAACTQQWIDNAGKDTSKTSTVPST